MIEFTDFGDCILINESPCYLREAIGMNVTFTSLKSTQKYLGGVSDLSIVVILRIEKYKTEPISIRPLERPSFYWTVTSFPFLS